MAEMKKGGAKGSHTGRWGGKFASKRKFCTFCANKINHIDYKDIALLSRYISDRGKIEPRRRTGTCNLHQHALALAIKQARQVALLPFVPEHIHKQGIVPPLTNPNAVKAEKTEKVEEAKVEKAEEVKEAAVAEEKAE